MEISVSIGPFGALTLAFIILKLAHLIRWSWFAVFSPILFVLSLPFLLFLILFLYFLVEQIIEDWGRLIQSIRKRLNHGK